MKIRYWPWGIVLLLIAGWAAVLRPLAWAQVDTNEGGGQEYVDELYGRRTVRDSLESRVGALEAYLSHLERRETGDIQQQIRQIRIIEANRRKLAELESRLQVLESLQRLDAAPVPRPNGLRKTGAKPRRGGERAMESAPAAPAST